MCEGEGGKNKERKDVRTDKWMGWESNMRRRKEDRYKRDEGKKDEMISPVISDGSFDGSCVNMRLYRFFRTLRRLLIPCAGFLFAQKMISNYVYSYIFFSHLAFTWIVSLLAQSIPSIVTTERVSFHSS